MSADALGLLRASTVAGQSVTFANDVVQIGNVSIARGTPTTYRSRQGKGPAYTVESVWCEAFSLSFGFAA